MKSLLLCLLLFSVAYTGCTSEGDTTSRGRDSLHKRQLLKLREHAADAAAFAGKHGYNTRFCFLADMSLASGSNRFFVYDLKADSIETAGLVAHGRCNKLWLTGRKYSNTTGSGCTSLGKYKIGKPYEGRFGLAYKLYGLDPTNSNAFERFVVLHAHECVPMREVYPVEICQSDGCPTVSILFLAKLAKKIDQSRLPVLLWVYE